MHQSAASSHFAVLLLLLWKRMEGGCSVTVDHWIENARYNPLFRAIGTSWGGDASPNFNIPDLRGRFVKGVDKNTAGVPSPPASNGLLRDPDRDGRTPANPDANNPVNQGNSGNNVGSMQLDAFQIHHHSDTGHSHSYTDRAESGQQYVEPGNNSGDPYAMRNAYDRTGTSGGSGANVTTPTPASATVPIRAISGETRVKNAYVYWIIRYR